MGEIKQPERAKLFCAIMYAESADIASVISDLENAFGKVETRGEKYPFTYTDYYTPEFGGNLYKEMVVFGSTVEQEKLAEIKRFTNSVEEKYLAENGKRSINIDPGFVLPSKLILASTKDFSHRIYVGEGIYAEITFMFSRKGVRFLDWTYPDYRSSEVSGFFIKVREKYMSEMKSGGKPE